MSAFNAYPPTRNHHTTCIPPSRAQQLLAEFLEDTVTNPSLHPNAILTEDGPVNRSASMGLVLHNLKRVEAGLRGEHIAADLSFKNFGGEGLPYLMGDAVTNGGGGKEGNRIVAEKDQGADWQDKDEYEREQAVEQGELGSRTNTIEDPGIDGESSKIGAKIPAVKPAREPGQMEKDERARKKKEKRDQKRKDREKTLQQEAKIRKGT
ncbi:MAG: hypothetical protein Q9170_000116 [Blastenia crenularia]